MVLVAPITHAPPEHEDDAVEIPTATKVRLGLDERRSWIVATELNRFIWPGPDLRPIARGKPDTFAYGSIPLGLLKRLIELIRLRRARTVSRGG